MEVTKYIGPFGLALTLFIPKTKILSRIFSPLGVEIFGYNHVGKRGAFERKLTAIEFHPCGFLF